ncbi:MAG TPA: hypothetical protein VJ833_13635 [Rhodanobacteraceae bacterium]|nr:hypothetical protein [Rhodanobacteraceae bacterium]
MPVPSGVDLVGAIGPARGLVPELGHGHVTVTALADAVTRYSKKPFNPEFLRSNGLPGARLARSRVSRPASMQRGMKATVGR